MLYIVATPIGNMGDISGRVREALEKADLILAEDTRKSGMLLKKLGIGGKKMMSFFEHNEQKRTEEALSLLRRGLCLALVSNAGTPCISDPGYKLVRRCREESLEVTALPGPSAVINALVLSGLPTDTFFFAGFLPRKKGQRLKKLAQWQESGTTLVILESPYRVHKLLEEIKETLGQVQVAVVREMTKVHEEVVAGTAAAAAAKLKERNIKGEVTVVIDTRPAKLKNKLCPEGDKSCNY